MAAGEPGPEAGDASRLKAALIAEARALGFDRIGITDASLPAAVGARFDQFLAADRHGTMDWLARTPERRRHPQGLWSDARSVIVLATNYGPEEPDPLAITRQPRHGAISVYARGDDYHEVLKKRVKALGRWLAQRSGQALKVFVDTAPVLEKPLGQQAGLGWQGKHTNLVSRQYGSWLFLAEIYSAAELPPDPPEPDHCGRCQRCLAACPTAAFPAPYQLDARRCISYLTIEHKGPIPLEFRTAIGNRIYGCDDCLAICPWNKFASRTAEIAFHPRAALVAPLLADLAGLDDAGFRTLFARSPVKRIGRARFLRNVLIAIGNSGATELADAAAARLDDLEPLVRGAAVWALARLAPARLGVMPAHEADQSVIAEWQAARRQVDHA